MKGLWVLPAAVLVAVAGCGSETPGTSSTEDASEPGSAATEPFAGATSAPCDADCQQIVRTNLEDLEGMAADGELAELCAYLDEPCFLHEFMPEEVIEGPGWSDPDGCVTNWDIEPYQMYAEMLDYAMFVEGMPEEEAVGLCDGVIPRVWQGLWELCQEGRP